MPDDDSRRWLELHAMRLEPLTFECACSKLMPEGKCGIYETRPLLCRLFPVGSKACIDAVRMRRTSEQYQQIRDKNDPITYDRKQR